MEPILKDLQGGKFTISCTTYASSSLALPLDFCWFLVVVFLQKTIVTISLAFMAFARCISCFTLGFLIYVFVLFFCMCVIQFPCSFNLLLVFEINKSY